MLKQIFIKNYKETDNPEVRNQYGKVAGIFGIISNLILGIIKLIIGFISNSISIMADAVNNLSDMASSALTIIGFKLASKKPNHEHPYGYARYEYVTGFGIAILLLIMGLVFAKESIVKIIHPEDLVINVATYIVLFIAILGKGLQMLVYLDFAKSINSNAEFIKLGINQRERLIKLNESARNQMEVLKNNNGIKELEILQKQINASKHLIETK